MTDSPSPKFIARVVGLFFGLLILLILLFGSFATVNSGYVGIITTFGKVTGEMQPGVHLKWPLVQHVTAMNVQVQSDSSDESAATNDLQTVTTTVVLNYHLDHARVDDIYVNLTPQYQNNYIAPVISEALKSVTAKFTAEQLLTERPQVTSETEAIVVNKLQPRGIIVDNFSTTNFAYSNTFTTAVEAKQAAQQAAQQAQYNLQKAQLDAQANQVQDAALTPAILEQQFLSKWNGVLPTTLAGGTAGGTGTILTLPIQ